MNLRNFLSKAKNGSARLLSAVDISAAARNGNRYKALYSWSVSTLSRVIPALSTNAMTFATTPYAVALSA